MIVMQSNRKLNNEGHFPKRGKRTTLHIAFDLPNSVTGLLVVVIRATVELGVVVVAGISVEWIKHYIFRFS